MSFMTLDLSHKKILSCAVFRISIKLSSSSAVVSFLPNVSPVVSQTVFSISLIDKTQPKYSFVLSLNCNVVMF